MRQGKDPAIHVRDTKTSAKMRSTVSSPSRAFTQRHNSLQGFEPFLPLRVLLGPLLAAYPAAVKDHAARREHCH